MRNAAAYLRSSKDRNDVSLAAQLTELSKLAQAKSLSIIRTYEDAVQSGSTDDRPAFAELSKDLTNSSRGWSTLLVYDTSRIARGRHIAQVFKYECRRHGVELVIQCVPETDPISAIILESVMEAFDEIHSLSSRMKGLAGMRENVRQGWRAGGRAPWGYQLEHTPTGAIRDGKPVMKSKLIPNADADKAAGYLRKRAAGVPRSEIRRQMAIDVNPQTLIGIEWNAMTYAGHTVWNKHASKIKRGIGQSKRRDRSEWITQRDTHPALITEAQAESIVAQLETSDVARSISIARCARGAHLLSGRLYTEDGRMWVAAGDSYRLKPAPGMQRGKFTKKQPLEAAIISRVRDELRSSELINVMVAQARAIQTEQAPDALLAEIAKLTRQRERAARLALEQDPDVYTRLVTDLGRQIEALRREADALTAERQQDDQLRAITPEQVRTAIEAIDNDRALITALVSRVVFNPGQDVAKVEYCLPVASPTGADRWAAPVKVSIVRLAA